MYRVWVNSPIEPAPVTGQPRELINRLMRSLAAESLSLSSFSDTALAFPMALGIFARVQVEADRKAFLARLDSKLEEILATGVFESFLVRSIRNEIDSSLTRFTDLGETTRKRQEFREWMEQLAADPAQIDDFRARATDPRYATMSDDELRQEILSVAGYTALDAPGPDEASEKWTAVSQWQNARELYLRDEDLDQWAELHRGFRRRGGAS